MSLVDDNEELINKKIETIFGINEVKEKDLINIKSLLVELYEEKHGTIPVLNIFSEI
jgi:hypothetical protein